MDPHPTGRTRSGARAGAPPSARDPSTGERRLLRALIAFQAFDGIASAVSAPWVVRCLDDVGCPSGLRPWLPVIKAVSVVGLTGGVRLRWLGRATSVGLTTYFTAAVAAHLRVRDIGPNFAAARTMLGVVLASTRLFWRSPIVSDRARG